MAIGFIWERISVMPPFRLVRFCEHHASILRSVSEVRLLNQEECDFLSAYDFYQDGLLGIIQLRSAARKYFID